MQLSLKDTFISVTMAAGKGLPAALEHCARAGLVGRGLHDLGVLFCIRPEVFIIHAFPWQQTIKFSFFFFLRSTKTINKQ